MNNSCNNCVWIGIGSDIDKSSALFRECVIISETILNNKINDGAASFHMNLYDLDVPEKNIDTIISETNKIASKQKSFDIIIKNINFFPFGIIFIEFEPNSNLLKLHQNLVQTISPLKEKRVCQDYLEPHRKYNSAQKSMLKLHGNPFVLSQFRPHITLGMSTNNDLRDICNRLSPVLKSKKFTLNNIHINTNNQKNLVNLKLTH